MDVRPSDVHDGASLQTLLDTYANKGPITVCLEPGTYTLPAPLVLGPELDGLTLQACREGVVLQAQSKPGADFIPGLIVMQDMSSVTIRGIWLSVPLTPFSPPSGSFSSLPQANQSLLGAFSAGVGVQVAIGISVNGSVSTTIEDCTFELPDPGQANSFGAGIFATGAMNDLQIAGCTFQSANPPTTVPFNDLAAGNQVQPPYQVTFGYLQVPGASASSTEATPTLLHDATFEQSLFQGLTVPALAMAQIGTLRVDQNMVRNSYAGFWFVSIADPTQLLAFDQFAVGDPKLYSSFVLTTSSALLDRIFVIATAIGQVLSAISAAGGPLVSRQTITRGAAPLTLARQTLSAIFTHATRLGGSSEATTSGTTEQAKLNELPPEIDALFTNLGAPASEAPVPVADTGTSGVPLRLDLCDCQIDAIIADSYSGAGLFVLDFTAEPGSALLHDNRIRSRFPNGETVFVAGLWTGGSSVIGFGIGQASVTGNVVANEVVPVTLRVPMGELLRLFEANYSMVLYAATTPYGAPAAAITGNVFIDPTDLPSRQNISQAAAAAGLDDWDTLNTVLNYVVPPVVTGISVVGASPASGPESGGTTVTVNGSGFTGVTGINFGLTPASNWTFQSDSQLTVVSPAVAASGPVDVTIVNPAGTSPIVRADQFTYIAGPVVTGISPARGRADIQVTIAGSGFTGATKVRFGFLFATVMKVDSDTQITATVPSGTGIVGVLVITPAGTSTQSPADQFTYISGPDHTGIALPAPEVAEPAAPEVAEPAAPQVAAPEVPAAEKQAAAAPEQQRAVAEEQAPTAPEEQAPAAEGAPPTAPIEIAPAVPVRPPLRVRVTNSVDEGRSFALESGELIIGREEGSAIQLHDSGVSHNHALLRVHGENVTIEDLRSTNGTKVNGAAIDGQTDLGPGDQIDVGGVQLVVEHNQVTDPDQS